MTQRIRQPKAATPERSPATPRSREGSAADTGRQSQGVTREQLHCMVAEAAYLIAEQRDFRGDQALSDWLRAEAEVGARFSKSG